MGCSDLASHKTRIISNEEMNDIIKITKSFEKSDILIKDVSETIKNEVKEQKGGFLSMLLGILDAIVSVNLSTGKGVMRAGEGTIGADQNL